MTDFNIRFEVTVSEKYKWGDYGHSHIEFDIPEEYIEYLDVSGILQNLLPIAIREYKMKNEKENENDQEEEKI